MLKTILIIVIAVGIITAVLIFRNKPAIAPEDGSNFPAEETTSQFPSSTPTPTPTPTTKPTSSPITSASPASQTVIITFANGTATPREVNIKVGDTVKFVNQNTTPHWPASGVHPTHQICPGFDALRGIGTGEYYSFTFKEAKTCPWHDHLNVSVNGKIIVSQ